MHQRSDVNDGEIQRKEPRETCVNKLNEIEDEKTKEMHEHKKEIKRETESEREMHSQLQSHLPIPGERPTPQTAGDSRRERGEMKGKRNR